MPRGQVPELTACGVETAGDVERLMRTAERNRSVKATDMNERSSRSHTLMQLRLCGTRGRQVLRRRLPVFGGACQCLRHAERGTPEGHARRAVPGGDAWPFVYQAHTDIKIGRAHV